MNHHRRTAALLLVGFVAAYGAAIVLAASMLLVRDQVGCACIRDAQAVHSATLGRWIGGGTLVILLALGAAVALFTKQAVDRSLRAIRHARIGRRSLAGSRVQVVAGTTPRAFCVGGWRPGTVVTTAFLRLPTAEQRAVLAHERAHAVARDPMVFAALDRIARILPPLRPLAVEFRRQAEFAADDAARRSAGDAAFAAALATGLGEAPIGTASFSPTEARVRRFLGRPYAAPRTPLIGAALTLAVILLGLATGFAGTRTAAARETLWCATGPVWCRGAAPLRSEGAGPGSHIQCRSTVDGTVCVLR